jgi:hypothetical protein
MAALVRIVEVESRGAASLLAANTSLLKVRDIGANHRIQRRLGADVHIEVIACDNLPRNWGRVFDRRDNRHLDKQGQLQRADMDAHYVWINPLVRGVFAGLVEA